MAKVIITEFVSLDGVAESPEKWSPVYWNAETEQFKNDELAHTSAFLLGRVTYELFAASWPGRSGAYADRFNSLPKFVASRSLRAVTWSRAQLLGEPVSESVARLKVSIEGAIYVHGSLSLAQFLLDEKLVDEVHLLMYPLLLGTGKRAFAGVGKKTLALIEARALASGVHALKYGVAAPSP